MKPAAIVEALIPLVSNEGAPFTAAEHERFETSLLSLYGGYTRGADVAGAWRDPSDGSVYRDALRTYYVIVLAEDAERVSRSLRADVETLYRQRLACVNVHPLISSTLVQPLALAS